MLDMNLVGASVLIGFILAIIFQVLIYLYFYRVKYEKKEENLLKNTLEMLKRLDSIENKLTKGVETNGRSNKENTEEPREDTGEPGDNR